MANNGKELTYESISAKYTGSKFDAHVHIGDKKSINQFLGVARKYNLKKSLGIIWGDDKDTLSVDFPDIFTYARFFIPLDLLSGNIKKVRTELDNIYSRGYSVLKFWFAPGWRDRVQRDLKINISQIGLDNQAFEPLFSHMDSLGLSILIHVGDPDLWYQQKYQPASKYGTKAAHLQELENIVARYPNLKFLGAHFAAQPEHLANLGRWFDQYPNFYVDTSSARWMAREFASQKDEARKFFIRYADRILFGTDIVTSRGVDDLNYFESRYLTYQALWETDEVFKLPIPDPENNNKTQIVGLNLPLDILKKIYWENALKFFSC